LRFHAASCQLLPQRSLRPHPNLLCLCFLLGCTVLCLRGSKLGSALRLVYRGQSCLEHLQANVLSKQPSAVIDLRHHSVVLVASEDVCANSTVVDQVDKPLMSFLRIRLCFSTPMRKFWSIDAGESYVQLGTVSIHNSACVNQDLKSGQRLKPTVWLVRPSLFVGTLFHGSHPQPAILPPGV
jgi:hypothetical protein